MILFPIGTVSTTESVGTINHITYKLWEPNDGCFSKKIYHNLVSQFDEAILTTRQKAEPTLSINYIYSNIFHKEYKQIEHFVSNRKSQLNPFFAVDWSSGYTPTTVASVAGDWQVVIDSTLDYSATINMKANYLLLWNGNKFRIGNVTNINSATRLTISKDYGNLSLTDSQNNANAYPIYEVYFTQDPLQNFTQSDYIGGNLSKTDFGGYMRSGTVAFISKYKVR